MRALARVVPTPASRAGRTLVLFSAVTGGPRVRMSSVPYLDLAETLQAVEHEPARVRKEALMAELLKHTLRQSSEELKLAVSLASLQLHPGERPVKLGMGNVLVVAALAEACGAPASELNEELNAVGDLGLVAEARIGAAMAASSTTPLTLASLHAALLSLEAQTGVGGATRKTTQLSALLQQSSPVEAKYVVRSIRGKLRTGLGDQSLRAALAQAAAAQVPDPSGDLEAVVQARVAATAAVAATLEEERAARASGGAGADKAAKAARKAQRALAAAEKKVDRMQAQRRRDAVRALPGARAAETRAARRAVGRACGWR